MNYEQPKKPGGTGSALSDKLCCRTGQNMFNDEHNKKHAKLLMAGLLGIAAVGSGVGLSREKTKVSKNHRANKKLKAKRKASRRR